MEYDRYQNNNKLYLLGIISLVLCLALLFFSLYILPFLIWKLNYDVPALITSLIISLQESYDLSSASSRFLVWLIFFIPALITGFISYYVSNYIDNKLYSKELEINNEITTASSIEKKEELKESAKLSFKIIGLMVIIVAVILFLQLLVQLTSS